MMSGKWKINWLRRGAAAGVVFLFVLSGAIFALYLHFSKDLPTVEAFAEREFPQSTILYDRNGKFLYEIHGEVKRTPVAYEDIPSYAKAAIVAIEDKDFYSHYGFDVSGIVRAFKKNYEAGEIRQGASTITQQLARNALLSREKTYERKIKEIILAVQIEMKYTKDEILHMYLNEIPFGSNAYGIEAASQIYFGKSAEGLSLPEAAYLAALPKAPTYFSPFGPNKEELDRRAEEVLQKMQEQGYITAKVRESVTRKQMKFVKEPTEIHAPHFVFYVQNYLASQFGEERVRAGGMRVYTSLDLDLHTAAQEMLKAYVEKNGPRNRFSNAALTAVDPRNGEILVMVGSRDFFDEQNDGQVNVTLRPRQPGSSIKPYVYARAFEEGMNPATMLLDVRTDFASDNGGKRYIPRNYSGNYRGPVSMRQALAGSLNIPAVKTLLMVGIDDAIDTAQRLGITTLNDRERFGPALVLGGGEVNLLEHTAALGVFGAQGKKHDLSPVLWIENSGGQKIADFRNQPGRDAVDPQVAYQISHVLSDNDARTFVFGRSNNLYFPGHTVAAKTGTTQEYRDGWTLGYTTEIAVGVWVGNNDNSPMRPGAAGAVVAAPLWNQFMGRFLAGKTNQDFTRPAGIVELEVDALSGKMPTQYTPRVKKEIFASFNMPTEKDDVHVPIEIGGERRVITRLYSERPDNPDWERGASAWALAAGFSFGSTSAIARQEQEKYEKEKEENQLAVGGGDDTMAISAPSRITSVPWEIVVSTKFPSPVEKTEVFLDGQLLVNHQTGNFRYASSLFFPDGQHILAIRFYLEDGQILEQRRLVEFSLERDI